MKRSFRILTLACMAMSLFASCSKEPNDPNGGNQPGPEPDKTYEYLFTVNEASITKATLGDNVIAFEEGDKLGIIAETPEKTTVTASEVFFAEGGASISFELTQKKGIEKGGKVYAWYPFAETEEQAKSAAPATAKANLCIPAEQQQNEATYDADAMPLVSATFEAAATLPTGRKITAGELTMTAVAAIAEFEIYSTFPGFTDQQILSVEWTAEGLAGNFTWDFASENPSLGTLTGNSAKTTVNTTESVAATKQDAAKIYMVVAPGQHAGAIKVKTTEAEYTLTLAEALTLEPGSVTPIEVNLENTIWSEAKTYRYRFAATAADNIFGTLSQPVGFFAGEENLEKTLAEGTFTYDHEEALAAGAAVYAYYPYNAEATAANALALSIPATQTNTAEGGFDASYIPVVAAPVTVEGTANQQEVNGTFQFRSLASVVKFNVYSAYAASTEEKVVSLKLDAEGIAGNFTWDLTAERSEWTVSGLDANSVLASPAAPAAIGADAENAAVVYAVVAPGTYTGTLTVITDKTTYEIALGQKTFTIAETVEVDVELPSSSNGFGATLEDFEITEMATKFSEESTIELYGADKEKVTLSYSEEGFKAENQVKGPYYAIYPEGAGSVNFNNGSFKGVIAAEQTLSEGKNIAEGAFAYFAMSNNPVLSFKNATSLVKVAVANGNVTAITLKAGEGQALAGEYTLAITDEGASVAAVEGKGSQTVTLKPAGETFPKGEYYIAVLPGASENLSIDFTIKTTDAEETASKTRALESAIERNSGRDLGLFLGYNISNAEELLAWNNDYKEWTKWDIVTLTDNINCAGVITSDNWTLRNFNGTLEGNGKTIKNFVIEKEGPAAFLGKLTGNALVKNLTFGEGCSFTTTGVSDGTFVTKDRVYAASLAIEARDGSRFENITNYSTVIGNHAGISGKGNYIGGICASVGSSEEVIISGCNNYGAITFSAIPAVWTSAGGLFGEVTQPSIKVTNCNNYGNVLFDGESNGGSSVNLAGISGGANAATFSSCVNYGSIKSAPTTSAGGNTNIGGMVGHNNGLALTITNCQNGSETPNAAGELIFAGASEGNVRIGGCIGCVENIATSVTGFKNYGKVTFNGTTATNIYGGGVIGYVSPFNCDNLIEGCSNFGEISVLTTIKVGGVGGIIGSQKAQTGTKTINKVDVTAETGKITINNCTNNGKIYKNALSSSGFHVAGIIGSIDKTDVSNGYISNCTNNGDVTNSGPEYKSGIWTYTAGIVGYAQAKGSITNCTNNGVITNGFATNGADQLRIGGIAGGADCGLIENCTNNGEVKDISNSFGGCIGGVIGCIKTNATTLTNCNNTKKVSALFSNEGKIGNKDGKGKAIYENICAGGIVGLGAIALTMTKCDNTGAIELSEGGIGEYVYVGGLVGYGSSKVTIKNSNNTKSVINNFKSSTKLMMSGIVGQASSDLTLETCSNSGALTNNESSHSDKIAIGGLAGLCYNNTITGCSNTGDITNNCPVTANEYVGGFVGQVESNMKTNFSGCSYNAAISVKVASRQYAGALVGRLTDKASDGITTTISSVTVKGTVAGTVLSTDNYKALCFGTSSDYKGTDGVTLAQ